MDRVSTVIHLFISIGWRAYLGFAAFWCFSLSAVGCFLLYTWPLPDRLSASHSALIDFADGTPAHLFLAPDDRWRIKVRLDEIDPHYVDALIFIEDKRFYSHDGVDLAAVLRAVIQNIKAGRIESGASTITMQLVRTLEPRPRTFMSKAIEAFRAYQLELFMDKDDILEAYLTFTPYGKNIEGIEAAALSYFGRRARDLDAEHIATLLSVPQNPNRRYPSLENKSRLIEARNRNAKRLAAANIFAQGESDDLSFTVLNRAPPVELVDFPRKIPHLAVELRQRFPDEDRLKTTIDPGMQLESEKLLAGFRDETRRKGVEDAAVLVIDRQTGAVLSMVGGFDFWEPRHAAMVASFFAKRSTGSALKPALYVMGIDAGFFLPEQLIEDTPIQYGSYSPENYDGSFSGLISMEEALSRSLNVPFVRLLADLGMGRFLNQLMQMDAIVLKDQGGDLGLSSALGLYLSPVELGQLYLGLSNAQQTPKIHWLNSDSGTLDYHLGSPGSLSLLGRALQRRDRPDFPARRERAYFNSHISWKTGTSTGHHDAWSAGWTTDHVAVVWMGNLDNRPSKHLVGSELAAPLMFDLLERFQSQSSSIAYLESQSPDLGLTTIDVCSYSGHIPSDACPNLHRVKAVRNRLPTSPCPYHVKIEIDSDTGLRVGPGCRSGRETKTKTALRLPAAVQRWIGASRSTIPRFAEGCEGITSAIPGQLRIQSPQSGQITLLIDGVAPDRQQIRFLADYPDPTAELTWYVDGKQINTASAVSAVWWTPTIGKHKVEVIDFNGLRAARPFEVRSALN